MDSERAYIRERKRKARHLSLWFRKMQVFPIQNKIVFSTFEGDGGFCCNPRYIAEETLRRGWDCEMIWLTHDTSRKFPSGIRAVKDTPKNIAYHLSTAAVWIDNYRKPLGTVKRKGQLYIQTWHASMGFKAVGLYRGNLFPEIARIVSEHDSSLIDYVISNSDYCTSIYPQKLLYKGSVLQVGSPRCDCLIKDKENLRGILRERYKLPSSERIVLYAPTFRGGSQKRKKQVVFEAFSLDINRVVDTLQKKTSAHWTMMLRLHPQLSAFMQRMPVYLKGASVIDVSQEDDMSQVLGAVDLVITDYSSCAFDALFCNIPVILFADDVEDYKKSRGSFMWEKDELPFMMSENNEQLQQCILDFDKDVYVIKKEWFMKKHNVTEVGNASVQVVDTIEKWVKEKCCMDEL